MSRNYDNWERLVASVLRRELLWQICHEQSTTTSIRSSISSDFSSSFRSTALFDFANQRLRSAHPLPFQTVAGMKTSSGSEGHERLVLFELAFGVEDLLMAPCTVLGDEMETYTSSYLVSFEEGVSMVATRWRRGNATFEVLNRRLKAIQLLEHENVVRLRGYFINHQDGSFGFYDYFPQGNLHAILHGKNRVVLEWEARMKIAIGVARGLVHIHGRSVNFVHGSVKASNVFVNSEGYGCVEIKPDYEISFRNRMCHAPEVYITKEVSQADDVYGFGVVMIELVSRRSPLHYVGRHATFADWAVHNARDEWTTMAFDRELVKDPMTKQAMWDMLGVALQCVRKKAEERPNMKDVVEMLELIPTTASDLICFFP